MCDCIVGEKHLLETWQAALIALGVFLALGLIVSMTLAHYIGGFFRTVEREAQEEAEHRKAPESTGTFAEDHGQES